MSIPLPKPIVQFFSHFPLYTYPPIPSPDRKHISSPTLWIHPPLGTGEDLLSSDVECLKWQAYLALRGLTGVVVRWDVSSEGAIDGRLPNLQIADELLAAHMIPGWVDGRVGAIDSLLEGYEDEHKKDESRAWVSLMEGCVHAALILAKPPQSLLQSLLAPEPTFPIQTLLSPPPPPLTGLSSLLPPYGFHISSSTVQLQYREAIASLSERLGTDKWFLGSKHPTALDALVFAYLHTILHAKDTIRIEVTKHVNLVAWECGVRGQVKSAFRSQQEDE